MLVMETSEHSISNLSLQKMQIALSDFVTSTFFFSTQYCNSLMYGLPDVQISKLQRVQNAAARLIMAIPKFAHITPALCELHWLPIAYRIKFKIIILTFKAIHGLTPSYISDFIRVKQKSSYSLRSNKSLLLECPRTLMRPTLGARSFTSASPALLSSLPDDIRNLKSFSTFKRSVKTFLFFAFKKLHLIVSLRFKFLFSQPGGFVFFSY